MVTDNSNYIYIEKRKRDFGFTMKEKHFHADYEIFYLISGERYYFIEDKTFHIKKGTLVFIDSNQIHKTIDCNNQPHERIFMRISEHTLGLVSNTELEKYLSDFFRKNHGTLQLNEKAQVYVENLLLKMLAEYENKETGYKEMILSHLFELLVFSQRYEEKYGRISKIATIDDTLDNKIFEVANYINENFHKKITLDDLEEKFYMSKFYLSRKFSEITGFTISEYINIKRVYNSTYLLDETDLTISEVAYKCGFNSLTYFDKVFKKYMNTTPRKYRKEGIL